MKISHLNGLSAARMAKISVVAAVYVALTVAISPLSYGDIQFRFAEMLMLLCFYNKDYIVSLTIGCAIANIFSPIALVDVPVGTAATLIAAIVMWKSKNIYIAAVMPVITNGLFVGTELAIMCPTLPVFWAMLSVALGEAAVLIAGTVLFKTVLEKNKSFMKLISQNKYIA